MFIKEAEIFRGIPSHIINEIAEIATEGVFQTGHVLFHKGDFADSLFILLLGDRVSRIFDTMLSYKT